MISARPRRLPLAILVQKQLTDLKNELKLYGHVQRKLSGAEGQSGMAASLAEDLYQKIGCAVEHLRLLSKAFRGRDMSGHPHDAPDLIQAAELLLGDG